MNNHLEKIWQDVLGHLSKELKGPSFQTWIKPTKLINLSESLATIAVKNEFNKNFLSQCYLEKIKDAVSKVLRKNTQVEITVKSDLSLGEFIPSIASLGETQLSAPSTQHSSLKSNINPSYTFENFVVGVNNQFCHSACVAVAEISNETYDPLFIHAGTGLGKTHLTHALAIYVLEQNKTTQVHYSASGSCTNELISSIRNDSMNKFREKFRNMDLLIIDDVQFLGGKEATQEDRKSVV